MDLLPDGDSEGQYNIIVKILGFDQCVVMDSEVVEKGKDFG